MDFLSIGLRDSRDWTPCELTKGFRKRKIDRVPPWFPESYHTHLGEAYSQQIHVAGDIFKLEKHRTQAPNVLPASFPNGDTIPGSSDPVTAFENALVRHAESENKSLLFSFKNAYNIQLRRAVGLPGLPNSSNQIAYLNSTDSFTHLHTKSMNLQSTNTLWYGHSVVWLVVSPRHAAKLEAQAARVLQLSPTCSQFVGHTGIIIPPSLLSQWGIEFTVFVQLSGEVVQTDYGAYCANWSTGMNLVEEISSSDDLSWQPPPLYRHCCNKCTTCPHPSSPRHEAVMAMSNSTSATLTDGNPNSYEYGDFSLTTSNHQSMEQSFETSQITVFLDPTVDVAGAPEDLDLDFNNLDHNLSDVEVECLTALQLEIENAQENVDPALLQLNAPNLVDSSSNPILPPFIFPNPSCELDKASQHPEGNFSDGFELVSNRDGHESTAQPSTEAERDSESMLSEECTPVPTVSSHFSRLSTCRSETTPLTSWDGASQRESLPYRSERAISLDSATQAASNSPTEASLPIRTGDFAREIEKLIVYGLRHERNMSWKSDKSIDAKKTLGTFMPSTPLDADSIMEVLLVLSSGRDEVRVVSHASFRDELRQLESGRNSTAENLGMMLLPIHEAGRCYLVALDVHNQLVTIYDNEMHKNMEKHIFLATGNSWEFSYKQIPNHKESNESDRGVALLFEAEKLLRHDVENLQDFDALRLRYLRTLLSGLLSQKSQASQPGNIQIPFEICSESPKHTSNPQRRPNFLSDLGSSIGCVEVVRDLIEMVGTLHKTSETPSSKLGTAMATFLLGEANTRLGALQKDISSLFIATRARQLLPHFQGLKEDQRKQKKAEKKRKREVQRASLDTIIDLSAEIPIEPSTISSNRCMTDVYNQLVKELIRPDVDADLLRQRVRLAHYHGRNLLPYQDVCGSDHPLWVLLPARVLTCPQNNELDVDPHMYMNLQKEEIRAIADSVRFSRPQLWRRLPQLQRVVEDLVRNIKPDVRILEELYEHAQECLTTMDLRD